MPSISLSVVLNSLKKYYKTYSQMVDFCIDNIIFNEAVMSTIQEDEGFSYVPFCNANVLEKYDTFEFAIIDELGAKKFKEFTNELVLYCEKLDLYIWAISDTKNWEIRPSNWKEEEEQENDKTRDSKVLNR